LEWLGYLNEDRQDILALVSFDGDAEHTAAIQAERAKILAPKRPSSPRTLHDGSSNNLVDGPAVYQDNKENTQKRLPSGPKTKTKTRPSLAAISGNGSLAIRKPAIPEPQQIPQVTVKPESMWILCRMFPARLEEYVAKPLDWRRFVDAMRDAGFETGHLGGSAVMFAQEGKGKIVFHKPHPVAKVDQVMLQRWGRRMAKWFSWQRESFVVVEKENGKTKDSTCCGGSGSALQDCGSLSVDELSLDGAK
jgi:hypothetical protein